jgi:hypothetical protein
MPVLLNPRIFAVRDDFSCRLPVQVVDLPPSLLATQKLIAES